jgi:hypothetical protein
VALERGSLGIERGSFRWKSRRGDVIVAAMANHRDLAKELYASSLGRTSASRIWRTVVFAGAMLAAPLGCGGGSKKADTTATPHADDNAAADKEAADKADADKAAADQEAADKAAADKAAADKAAADAAEEQAKKDQEAQEAADKAAAEEAAKKRPRGGGSRPTGRGFVLA